MEYYQISILNCTILFCVPSMPEFSKQYRPAAEKKLLRVNDSVAQCTVHDSRVDDLIAGVHNVTEERQVLKKFRHFEICWI